MNNLMKILITYLLLSTTLTGVEGFFKKIRDEVKRVGRQVGSLPHKIPRETKRVVNQVIGVTQPQTTTEVHSTRSPLQFSGEPIVTIDHESFEAKSYDDLVEKLKGVGIDAPEAFSRLAMNAKRKSHVSWRFLIPAMDAPQNKAKMSYLGVVASKEKENDDVTVKWSQMSAEVGVTAHEIFHWRTVRKQWGNNQETKNDEAKPRGLTSEEIDQISTELTNAIKSDPRFTSLPGEDSKVQEL